MKLDLKELRRVASDATQSHWQVEPSLKMVSAFGGDNHVCDYSDIKDAKHIAAFNPKTALALLDLLDKAVSMAEWYSYDKHIEGHGDKAREFLSAANQE